MTAPWTLSAWCEHVNIPAGACYPGYSWHRQLGEHSYESLAAAVVSLSTKGSASGNMAPASVTIYPPPPDDWRLTRVPGGVNAAVPPPNAAAGTYEYEWPPELVCQVPAHIRGENLHRLQAFVLDKLSTVTDLTPDPPLPH
mgnify:CR=1 FL=1